MDSHTFWDMFYVTNSKMNTYLIAMFHTKPFICSMCFSIWKKITNFVLILEVCSSTNFEGSNRNLPHDLLVHVDHYDQLTHDLLILVHYQINDSNMGIHAGLRIYGRQNCLIAHHPLHPDDIFLKIIKIYVICILFEIFKTKRKKFFNIPPYLFCFIDESKLVSLTQGKGSRELERSSWTSVLFEVVMLCSVDDVDGFCSSWSCWPWLLLTSSMMH